MSNQNMNSMSNPINPVVAVPNLPAPQVISGTLGQQGLPPVVNPPLNLPTITQTDLLTNTDLLGSIHIDTSMTTGTELFSTTLPVVFGPFFQDDSIMTHPLNWLNLPLSSHVYYNPIQHLGFLLIGPEPVRGKILAVWNPTDVNGSPNSVPLYSARRRMITEEWDFADSKMYFRTFQPLGLVNQMPTDDQPQPRTPDGQSEYVSPNFSVPGQFKNFGRFSLFLEQEIQVGSIFPKEYTILVFACFAGTSMSVPVDFRRSNFSNLRNSILTPHRNYLRTRFNQTNPTPTRGGESKDKLKRDLRAHYISKFQNNKGDSF